MDDQKEMTLEEQRQVWLASLIDAEPEDGVFCGDPDVEAETEEVESDAN